MSLPGRDGWLVTLVGGPYESARPRNLMSNEPLPEPPTVIHVHLCPCCDRIAAVAPGRHAHEDELGPATTYRLLDWDFSGRAEYVYEVNGDRLVAHELGYARDLVVA